MPPIHRPLATAAAVAEVFGSGPVAVADVLAAGVTEGQLRAAVRSGAMMRVRHGVVAVSAEREGTWPAHEVTLVDKRRLHRELVVAAVAATGPDAKVSHASAGMLHGLPSLRPGAVPARPILAVPSHGRIRTGIHVRLATIPEEDIDVVDGVPCTGLARTALDMSRFRPLHESLVVMDAVAAREGVAALRSSFDRMVGRYGMKGLAEAIALADPRAESPLESASRGYLHEVHLPLPELQAWIRGADARSYRVDFLWRDRRVVGEADGWAKYTDLRDLREEKRREDALRSAGFSVVRWTSDELWRTPDTVMARIRRALTA
jgi:hypothetical protein